MKAMNNQVSIIVPVYNTERFLDRCLNSITGQTYPSLEIILVNDGSTDNSLEICRSYALCDSRLIVISKEHSGLSDARNAGIEAASSGFIQFVDSDDFILPEMTSVMMHAAEETGADIIQCNVQEFSSMSDIKHPSSSPPATKTVSGDERFALLVKNYYPTVLQVTKIFRREIFSDLRFPSGKYHEDEFLIHHELDVAKSIALIDKPYYCYYQNPNGIVAHMTIEKRFHQIESFMDRLSFLVDHGYVEIGMNVYVTLIFMVRRFEEELKKNNADSATCSMLKEYKKEINDISNRYFPWKSASC